MKINHSINTFTFNQKSYNLQDLKDFILDNFPTLSKEFKIAAVNHSGTSVRTYRQGDMVVKEISKSEVRVLYDYDGLIKKAEKIGIVKQFIEC